MTKIPFEQFKQAVVKFLEDEVASNKVRIRNLGGVTEQDLDETFEDDIEDIKDIKEATTIQEICSTWIADSDMPEASLETLLELIIEP